MAIVTAAFRVGWAAVQAVTNVAAGIITGIVNRLAGAIGGAVNIARNFIGGLGNAFAWVRGVIGGAVEGIAGAVGGLADRIIGALQRAIDFVQDNAHRVLGPLGSIGKAAGGFLGGAARILGFAEGTPHGHTTPTGEPFIVGEAGPELLYSESRRFKVAPSSQTLGLLDQMARVSMDTSAPRDAGDLIVRGPLVEVGTVVVRDDADITRLSRQLAKDVNRRRRAGGLDVPLNEGTTA